MHHHPADLINREAAAAWAGTGPHAHNTREPSSGAVRCVLFWPWAFCLPSVRLPTPQRCVTPNRTLAIWAICARLNLLLSPEASLFPAGLLSRRRTGWIVRATERIDASVFWRGRQYLKDYLRVGSGTSKVLRATPKGQVQANLVNGI